MGILSFVVGGPRDEVYDVMYGTSLRPIGCIYKEVDGFYVFYPVLGGGCWGDEVLKELSEFLININAPWRDLVAKQQEV